MTEYNSADKKQPVTKWNFQDGYKYIGNDEYNQRHQDLCYFYAAVKGEQWYKNILRFPEHAFQTVGKAKAMHHSKNQRHKIDERNFFLLRYIFYKNITYRREQYGKGNKKFSDAAFYADNIERA